MIKILVPADYKVPDLYTNATPTQKAIALGLGADAVTYFQKRAIERVRAETHDEAMREATATFETQLEEVRQGAEQIQKKLRLEKEKLEQAYQATQTRLSIVESTAATTRSEALKEARQTLDELLRAKDDQIALLHATIERQIGSMTTKVESLQNSFTKTFSSSKEKGGLGETLMEGFLKKAYDCDVSVVSKESHTADIRMTRRGGGTGAPAATYLWEIKNYTRMVTTEEIEKFRRDLRLHPDVRGGCLVSLRTGIVGHTRGGDVDLEFLEDGRFVLFLSHFMSHEDPIFVLQVLRPFFETIEAMHRPAQEEGATIRALEAKAALLVNILRNHMQSITRHKNSLYSHRKRVDAMFAEFQGFLLEQEAQLQTMLRVALGDAEEGQAEADMELPQAIFKKGTLADVADEKAREFVKWFVGATHVEDGSQIELKELLDRAKEQKWSEKTVRALREDLFHDSAWTKGSRFISGVRWRAAET